MTHFVYILLCKSKKNYSKTYVGYTTNLKKRLFYHNSNKGAKSTKGFNCVLVNFKLFKFKSDALKFEYLLKNKKKERSNFYKKII